MAMAVHTFAILFFCWCRKPKEFFALMKHRFLQTRWNGMIDELEETELHAGLP